MEDLLDNLEMALSDMEDPGDDDGAGEDPWRREAMAMGISVAQFEELERVAVSPDDRASRETDEGLAAPVAEQGGDGLPPVGDDPGQTTAVHEYTRIHVNRARGAPVWPKRRADPCDCKVRHGVACQAGCGCTTRQRQEESTHCPAGRACCNTVIQSGRWQPTAVIDTPDRGRGLTFTVPVPANTIALEYVGELLPAHEAEARERKRDTDADQAGHQGTYVHDFATDAHGVRWVIDARCLGGPTRHVNSSHEPNSVYKVWWVKDRPRPILRTL
eukprot:342708-Rhodomonas_salina.3